MPRFTRLLFLVVLFSGFSTQNSNAQAVLSGKITGQQGNILSGVILYRLNKMSSNTSSDADGNFKLNLPSDTAVGIVVKLSGYLSDTLTLKLAKGENRKIKIQLEQNTIELGTAVITDQRALETGMMRIWYM